MHSRSALGLLPLFLVLILTSGLAAQSPAGLSGIEAAGTATVVTARGACSGAITVDVAGPESCKVTLDVSGPARSRAYTAVLNGGRAVASGPAELADAAPPPVGPAIGCALLAPRVGASDVALSSVAGTARPATLRWTSAGHAIELVYGYGPASAALPSSITETVDGAVRLSVTLTRFTVKTFAVSDFALPARPVPTARPAAGPADAKGGAQ